MLIVWAQRDLWRCDKSEEMNQQSACTELTVLSQADGIMAAIWHCNQASLDAAKQQQQLSCTAVPQRSLGEDCNWPESCHLGSIRGNHAASHICVSGPCHLASQPYSMTHKQRDALTKPG